MFRVPVSVSKFKEWSVFFPALLLSVGTIVSSESLHPCKLPSCQDIQLVTHWELRKCSGHVGQVWIYDKNATFIQTTFKSLNIKWTMKQFYPSTEQHSGQHQSETCLPWRGPQWTRWGCGGCQRARTRRRCVATFRDTSRCSRPRWPALSAQTSMNVVVWQCIQTPGSSRSCQSS